MRWTGCSGWLSSSVRHSARVPRTTSGVPSFEPPSELTITAFDSGKYFARPRSTAVTTCPMVSALL